MYVRSRASAHPTALKHCFPTLVHLRRCCGAAGNEQVTRVQWSTWCVECLSGPQLTLGTRDHCNRHKRPLEAIRLSCRHVVAG